MSDLIDRQAAIDALDSINCFGYVEEKWDIVRGIIELVPSIQSERKEGRWMLEKVYDDGYGYEQFSYFCSECGAPAYEFHQPYCHRCGVKMGEKELNEQNFSSN